MDNFFCSDAEEMEVGDVITDRGRRYRLLDKTEIGDCVGFIWEKLDKIEASARRGQREKAKRKAAKRSRARHRGKK